MISRWSLSKLKIETVKNPCPEDPVFDDRIILLIKKKYNLEISFHTNYVPAIFCGNF